MIARYDMAATATAAVAVVDATEASLNFQNARNLPDTR